MLSSLFGKPKTERISPAETIKALNETIIDLEKREKFLESKAKKELEKARENRNKNKKVAIAALKRKKHYDTQLQRIAGAIDKIQTQISMIEDAEHNKRIFDAMKKGGEAMKIINDSMSVEKVEETMENIDEQFTVAEEISNAISNPLLGEQYDEDELLEELDNLDAEELEEELLSVPKVKETEVKKEVVEDEDDALLRELEEQMQ